jgi:hypothetical protein
MQILSGNHINIKAAGSRNNLLSHDDNSKPEKACLKIFVNAWNCIEKGALNGFKLPNI